MALATYTDLQASIATWLKRDDLTSVIPDFIALAESRLMRDLRLRQQITSTTLTTVAGQQSVTLPTDFLEFENVSLRSSQTRSLSYAPVEHIDTKYPTEYTGTPAVYAIEGQTMLLGPTPDAVYSLPVIYYAKWPALSVTPTNWLLTNHPGLYLFASLAEAQPYMLDDQRIAVWESKYQAVMAQVQSKDETATHSGSALRVKTI